MLLDECTLLLSVQWYIIGPDAVALLDLAFNVVDQTAL